MNTIANLLLCCAPKKEKLFATDTPVCQITCSLPFPTDLLYQLSPDSAIIIGRKRIKPGIFEISAFDILSGKKHWQLSFLGKIVGQTSKQILVYEEQTQTIHFVNPTNGAITRKVTPAPSSFTSKAGLEMGMAFSDEMYVTTLPLYAQIVENGKADHTWRIGITAKTWNDNKTQWFVSPVKQIVILEYTPFINENKLLIINSKQSIDGKHSYQLIDLKTGKELSRTNTEGEFISLNTHYFIEKTPLFIRCFDPFSGKEYWKISNDFRHSAIYSVGKQLSIVSTNQDKTRTVLQINANTGITLKNFDLLNVGSSVLNGIFLKDGNQIWLNFSKDTFKIAEERPYDYWVGYDENTHKVLWRTDFKSPSTSTLLPFVPDKMSVKQ